MLDTPASQPMSQISKSPADRRRRLATYARYGTTLLIVVAFVGTHFPAESIPHSISTADKWAHGIAYMAIAFSVLTSLELSLGLLRPHHYFAVWLIGTLYGAFDELTQIPVGRHCDGLDWLCDILGLLVGLTLYRLLRPLVFRVTQLNFALH